jgi:hypothetical protein
MGCVLICARVLLLMISEGCSISPFSPNEKSLPAPPPDLTAVKSGHCPDGRARPPPRAGAMRPPGGLARPDPGVCASVTPLALRPAPSGNRPGKRSPGAVSFGPGATLNTPPQPYRSNSACDIIPSIASATRAAQKKVSETMNSITEPKMCSYRISAAEKAKMIRWRGCGPPPHSPVRRASRSARSPPQEQRTGQRPER